MKSEEPDIGLLKGYKVSICLKENNHLIYFVSQKIPIHILPMVMVKLKKMVKQGIYSREFPKVEAVDHHQLLR